jgi:hypothetical protein
MVFELYDGSSCNPLGKVWKRLTNGEEDSLAYFYKVFAKDAPRPPEPLVEDMEVRGGRGARGIRSFVYESDAERTRLRVREAGRVQERQKPVSR